MNRMNAWMALAASALVLSACGGSGDNAPQVTVDNLATGSYVVAVGDTDAPTVGKYYAGADGRRLLVLADSSDRANQLYRREAEQAWVAVPVPEKDVNVTLLRNSATSTTTVTATALAGNYVTLVATGVTASFSVKANGDISAGTSACKLSGKLAASSLPNTLALSLAADGCGSLPTSSTGVLVVDGDYAPARFRLVADNGAKTLDLWAFAE